MGNLAAPLYVGRHHLGDAPAGHRFMLYLPLWNAHWAIDDGAKHGALDHCCALGDGAELLTRLRARQQAQAEALPAERRLVIDAEGISPFATGLGNGHPVENGFAFLSPYGLPYLAGSGCKGVLRRAMQELRGARADGIEDPLIDALFGPEDRAADGSGPTLPDEQRRRGALNFWDVYPEPPSDPISRLDRKRGGKLCVEVMTPHLGKYYQGKESPHDSGKPEPIFFLALPPKSMFRFVVTHEPALMPAGLGSANWQQALEAAFERAFDWLGFGAKTAVGYGAMGIDSAAKRAKEARLIEAKKLQEDAQNRRTLREMLDRAGTPAERAVIEFLNQRTDQSQPELNALIDGLGKGRFGELARDVALVVRQRMEREGRWKLASAKKNPAKDREFQDTLKVKKFLDCQ